MARLMLQTKYRLVNQGKNAFLHLKLGMTQRLDNTAKRGKANIQLGRRVHFALQRQMLKPLIARLDLINHQSEETGWPYEAIVKRPSTRR